VETNLNSFREWLITDCGYHKRSAGDILSRRRKLLALVPTASSITLESISRLLNALQAEDEFTNSTMRAMLRSEKLYREFENSAKK